jgi:hypothetical protein
MSSLLELRYEPREVVLASIAVSRDDHFEDVQSGGSERIACVARRNGDTLGSAAGLGVMHGRGWGKLCVSTQFTAPDRGRPRAGQVPKRVYYPQTRLRMAST